MNKRWGQRTPKGQKERKIAKKKLKNIQFFRKWNRTRNPRKFDAKIAIFSPKMAGQNRFWEERDESRPNYNEKPQKIQFSNSSEWNPQKAIN